MLKKILGIIFPVLLVLIVGYVCYRNYIPGTWLSGWDTLHPEFNFGLYLKRAFDGVWMSHQGVGAVASQSHPAELSRLLILYPLYKLLPSNLVRYSFFFLTLITGSLGTYFLAKSILGKENVASKLAAFLGAFYYVFNLSTVQQYYVPLEMFAVEFATLPWIFLTVLNYLKGGGKRRLLVVCLVSFFASSMAHTATLFYVWLFCFGVFLAIWFLLNLGWKNLKRILVIVFIVLLTNAFWIAPNIYFVINYSREVSNSNINTNFTPEAILQSQQYGDFNDLILGKNFLFNWRVYDFQSKQFVDLLGGWTSHLEQPIVTESGYLLFGLGILGIVLSLIKRKKILISFLPVFVISIFFWINENPPFTNAYAYLVQSFPTLKEALRFPFTKFSFLLTLSLSIYLSYFVYWLFEQYQHIRVKVIPYLLILITGILVLEANIFFIYPVFQGDLISNIVKTKIPDEYFQMFKWFEGRQGRIAKLPMQTMWGWNYYSWGYQGAGFTWFGLTDPTFDREFDRWNSSNEDFYNQASFALYNQSPEEFVKVLQQYNVKYLLMDNSVFDPGGNKYQPSIDSLSIKEVAKFGFLTIYEVAGGMTRPGLVSDPTWTRNDQLVITEKFAPDQGFAQAKNCDLKQLGTVVKERRPEGNFYGAYDGAVACDYFYYPDIKYDRGYMLHIQGENLKGRSLKIYLQNYVTGRMDVEELLPTGKFDSYYPVLPKLVTSDMGMNLNVETRAFGRIASENLIEKIEFIPVDFVQNNQATTGQNIVTNNQAYEQGWIAIANNKILPHIKVNGWENGWVVPNAPFVFFWPQLLEWGGMAIGIGTLLILVLTKGKPKL